MSRFTANACFNVLETGGTLSRSIGDFRFSTANSYFTLRLLCTLHSKLLAREDRDWPQAQWLA